MAAHILPEEDADIAETLAKRLQKDGVTIYTSSSVEELDKASKRTVIQQQDERIERQAEYVLIAVGPRATELIGQGVLMMHAEMNANTMEDFVAAHPTLAEAIQEAVRAAMGAAVHI